MHTSNLIAYSDFLSWVFFAYFTLIEEHQTYPWPMTYPEMFLVLHLVHGDGLTTNLGGNEHKGGMGEAYPQEVLGV